MIENKASFYARIEPCFAPSDVLKIKLAYMLAKHGHRAQVRKERDEAGDFVRYFEHLRRVSLNGIDIARLLDVVIICCCILHDTLEDTEDITPELLEMCFGREVVSILKVLSKTPKEGYHERFWACTDWRPYAIKACDRLDNLMHVSSTTREFMEKLVKETKEEYFPLFLRMVELAPAERKPGLEVLRTMVIQQVGVIEGTLRSMTAQMPS